MSRQWIETIDESNWNRWKFQLKLVLADLWDIVGRGGWQGKLVVKERGLNYFTLIATTY